MRGASLSFAVVVAVAGCAASTGNLSGYDPSPDPSVDEPPDIGPLPPQKGPQPQFGSVRRRADTPPLSGGTLLLTKDKTRLVAADPDRDRVFVVTLANQAVTSIPLVAKDEPGRLTEDSAGNVHIALRRAGVVVTIDPVNAKVVARRGVCPAPRGIASDPTRQRLLVACEGGEMIALPEDPAGTPTSFAKLTRDLRDVIVSGDTVYVSRFRTADVMTLSATNPTNGTWEALPSIDPSRQPTLAWRMVAGADGHPVVAHQSASVAPVVVSTPSGYGAPSSDPNDCGTDGIVLTNLTSFTTGSVLAPKHLVLPVDVAVDGDRLAVVAAGNAHTKELPQVFLVDSTAGGCGGTTFSIRGQATSIVTLAPQHYAVLSREPAQIELLPAGDVISLADDSVEDTGHAIFHSNSGAGLACASCHGEAGDDGHVWTFDELGPRRTPSLRGTIAGTAPYHWDGNESDIAALAGDVLTKRMSGPDLSPETAGVLRDWLFALPAPAASTLVDPAAAARGKAIFGRADVKCATCHAGPMLTNSETMDVGSGGTFQVPSLVGVGFRAPFLHDGCASTLAERFSVCGSAKHGDTSKLSTSDVADLVAYLQTL